MLGCPLRQRGWGWGGADSAVPNNPQAHLPHRMVNSQCNRVVGAARSGVWGVGGWVRWDSVGRAHHTIEPTAANLAGGLRFGASKLHTTARRRAGGGVKTAARTANTTGMVGVWRRRRRQVAGSGALTRRQTSTPSLPVATSVSPHLIGGGGEEGSCPSASDAMRRK